MPKTTGIYALWHDAELLYVGIAYRDPSTTSNANAAGVQGRLRTYLDGWLTHDFTLAVALRFVIPHFTADQLKALADGSMKLKNVRPIVKTWISDNVTFSCVSAPGPVARAAEARARGAGPPDGARPSFNPSS